jgi:large subunit ribosomal protein L3
MAKGHKPVAGSRAYWPRKRAKRIYPRLRRVAGKEAAPLAFAGYKAGMTRIQHVDTRKDSATAGQEIVTAVTVIDVPALVVCGIKTYVDNGGLKSHAVVWSERIAKDLTRKTCVPGKTTKRRLGEIEKGLDTLAAIRLLVHTKPRESGIGKKKPELFELVLGGKVSEQWEYAKQKLGAEIRAAEVFKEGEWVDVRAVSTGKGFQGPVKRFGIKVRSRKNKKKRRHVGTLGPRTPARVLPAKLAMPGQLGFQTRTELNKRVMKIGEKGAEVNPRGGFLNYGLVKGAFMLVEGSVPGPKKRLIVIRKAVRSYKPPMPVQLNSIIQDSQQGL